MITNLFPNLIGQQGLVPTGGHYTAGGYVVDSWGNPQPTTTPLAQPTNNSSILGGNPFTSAMSGLQKNSLQPYVNYQNLLANNALYGGLLGYQPQSMLAGNAGGIPQSPQAPSFNLPGILSQGFSNRPWMNQNGSA